ncbi:hypothetical protein BKA70DRAFT_1269387 [Coprinopsis sp. MPI-PUGE-AT-0042]|nr:hypothetical protein BKA70DRAFT_1269387 [Coprinopsis sp. MPI-PUGE-AT-0042]
MDDAWQSQDIAPSGGISIPTHDSNGAPAEDQNWNGNGNGRSPPRERERERNGDREPPRRSSRSRSPGRGGEERREKCLNPLLVVLMGGNNPGNNLHVSGLSHKVDSRDLETLFAKSGRVCSKASVMYDPHTRDSRGFGFVTMETVEEAEAAIAALHGNEFMGKVMTIEKARRGRARTPTPGRYYGPPKRNEFERPYDPRPYDSRYRDYDDRRGGDRRRGGYDDYRRGGDDYRYRDRDYDRDRERDRYRDDRRYDDRRY